MIPIHDDVPQNRMRLWATIGVRLARLNARYLRAPRIKPAGQGRDWQDVPSHGLKGSDDLIAVDKFAEIDLPSRQPLTRDEFRQARNTHPSKEAIIEALSRGNH